MTGFCNLMHDHMALHENHIEKFISKFDLVYLHFNVQEMSRNSRFLFN